MRICTISTSRSCTNCSPDSDGWLWAIFIQADPSLPKDRGQIIATTAFQSVDAQEFHAEHQEDSFIVVPISAIVQATDKILADYQKGEVA